jgi:DUF4097 and DUF4098 domain-containing protein YvlB
MQHIRNVLILLLCSLGSLGATGAGAAEQIAIPVADPNRPVTLKATLLQGSIEVEAYEGKDVLLDWVDEDGEESNGEPKRVDGMYRIPNRSGGISAEAVGNEVTISSGWSAGEILVKVRVPMRTSVRAASTNGELISIRGVNGDHELSNVNGEIRAVDIGGTLVAQSTNGDIEVVFREATPEKTMSFITFNGDVDVTFPASFKGDLKMSSMQGEILSDFQLELMPSHPKVDRGDNRFSFKVEREVHARVGGGGPEIRLKTFNGDIRIRRR